MAWAQSCSRVVLLQVVSSQYRLFRLSSATYRLVRGLICTAICNVVLVLLLLVAPALAQDKPEAPKPKHDRKVFGIGVSLLAASATADAISSRQVVDRGGWENNPVLGRHPSNARLAGGFVAEFAAQALAFHFTERSRHRWLRWLGRSYIGLTIEEHSRLAACNAGINGQPTQHLNCGPLGF